MSVRTPAIALATSSCAQQHRVSYRIAILRKIEFPQLQMGQNDTMKTLTYFHDVL